MLVAIAAAVVVVVVVVVGVVVIVIIIVVIAFSAGNFKFIEKLIDCYFDRRITPDKRD
jgi:hypothetical protein